MRSAAKSKSFRPAGALPPRFEPLEARRLLAWEPNLLADINPLGQSSTPEFFMETNGQVLFSAVDGAHGRELWQTDGTSTELVLDIRPGSSDGIAASNEGGAMVATSQFGFFVAYDAAGAKQLWRTDGTPSGTQEVLGVSASDLIVVDDRLYFRAGYSVWTSDGTPVGTVQLAQFGGRIPRMFDLGGSLGVWARDANEAYQLWVSDGTVAGTTLRGSLPLHAEPQRSLWLGDDLIVATDFRDGQINDQRTYALAADGSAATLLAVSSARLQTLVLVGSEAWWLGRGEDRGELWRSDGTPGGTMLSVELPSVHPTPPYPTEAVALGSQLYFTWADDADGQELWSSDGTALGTGVATDLAAGSDGASIRELTAIGQDLYFLADTGDAETSLIKFDGDAASILQTYPLDKQSQLAPAQLTVIGGRIYFGIGEGSLAGYEPWSSDGTSAGTALLADVRGGTLSSQGFDIHGTAFVARQHIVAGNGTFYILATDDRTNQSDLWTSDGASAPTKILETGADGVWDEHLDFAASVGRLFFVAEGAWASDGTTEGTEQLVSSAPVVTAGQARFTAELQGRIWFAAGDRLWSSDGTAAGTTEEFAFDVAVRSVASPPVASAGKLWFVTRNELLHTKELYSFDPKTGLAEPVDLGNVSIFGKLTASADKLYFVGYDVDTGYEPWVTDGTLAGTHQLADITPGQAGLNPTSAAWKFQPFADGAFFTSDQVAERIQTVWFTNGTPAGTVPLPLQVLQKEGLFYSVEHDGWVHFLGTAASGEYQLTRTDGTVAGTVPVATIDHQWPLGDMGPPTWYEALEAPVSTPDLIFFQAYQDGVGWRLWQSDGTQAGTRIAVTSPPSISGIGGFAQSLSYANGRLVYGQFDRTYGREPFAIDLATNQAPIALAGAGYVVAPGGALELDATASYDFNGVKDPLAFRWDLDGDGQFGESGPEAVRGDEVGPRPVFLATGLEAVHWIVGLRVSDSRGGVTTVQTEVIIPRRGDATLDGRVTGADYTIWADHFGQTDAGFTEGDFNGDRRVDEADLAEWIAGYGNEVNDAPRGPSVPTARSAVALAPPAAQSPTLVTASAPAALGLRTAASAPSRARRAAAERVFQAMDNWRVDLQ